MAFAGTDGIWSELFAQSINPAFGGLILSTLSPADAATISSAATFMQQYQAAFGALGRYSASGYDSANVLLAAIAAAIARGAHPATGAMASAQDLRSAVLTGVTITKLHGVTGTLSFAANGDLVQGPISVEQLAAVKGVAAWIQAATAQVP